MNRYITLNISRDEALRYIEGCRFDKQKEIISKLLDNDKILISNVNSSINTLIRNGVIKYIYEEVNRYVSKSSGKTKPKKKMDLDKTCEYVFAFNKKDK